jgi:hypothetical protein
VRRYCYSLEVDITGVLNLRVSNVTSGYIDSLQEIDAVYYTITTFDIISLELTDTLEISLEMQHILLKISTSQITLK